MTSISKPLQVPRSYGLKVHVERFRRRIWCGSELSGIDNAPIYLFPDQAAFDSDEVDLLARSMLSGPTRLPHQAVIFEVTAQRAADGNIAAYATTLDDTVCGFLFGYDIVRGAWSDVIARASFLPDGVADVEGHPGLTHADADAHFSALTGLIWRGLALLATGTSVHHETLSPLRRRKYAKAGVSGWTYHVAGIDPSAVAAAVAKLGGTHASPRWHIRRGHWRQLANGRRVFVRECQVGDAACGGVIKDYRIDLGSAA